MRCAGTVTNLCPGGLCKPLLARLNVCTQQSDHPRYVVIPALLRLLTTQPLSDSSAVQPSPPPPQPPHTHPRHFAMPSLLLRQVPCLILSWPSPQPVPHGDPYRLFIRPFPPRYTLPAILSPPYFPSCSPRRTIRAVPFVPYFARCGLRSRGSRKIRRRPRSRPPSWHRRRRSSQRDARPKSPRS